MVGPSPCPSLIQLKSAPLTTSQCGVVYVTSHTAYDIVEVSTRSEREGKSAHTCNFTTKSWFQHNH